MKLRHLVVVGLVVVGGYVALHWLFAHGGMASVQGRVGNIGANAGVNY
jgi:hypothetical protein